jgi:UDP-N-acetyl-D-mannosaminuronate dehydrogenase
MVAVALRPGRVVTRVHEVLAARGSQIVGARVLVLGITYKPGVADIRESPALEVIAALQNAGAVVAYTDQLVPHVRVGGAELRSVSEPDQAWDLVIVHTIHPDADLAWLRQQACVLDTTYRLDCLPDREVL